MTDNIINLHEEQGADMEEYFLIGTTKDGRIVCSFPDKTRDAAYLLFLANKMLMEVTGE